MVVAFRRHTLLPLDDCYYALQPSIPHLTRLALHRCLQRHGISRLPDIEGDKPQRKKFKRYPIEFLYIDIVEVRTAESSRLMRKAITKGYAQSAEVGAEKVRGPSFRIKCKGLHVRVNNGGRSCHTELISRRKRHRRGRLRLPDVLLGHLNVPEQRL